MLTSKRQYNHLTIDNYKLLISYRQYYFCYLQILENIVCQWIEMLWHVDGAISTFFWKCFNEWKMHEKDL